VRFDYTTGGETMIVIGRSQASLLQPHFEQLERVHFPASRFSEPHPGKVAAQFFRSSLTSAFQPVARAEGGEVIGHQALLRVFDEAGLAVAPWNVFAQAAQDTMLVQLDRLTRTVHALNYFPKNPQGTLFLNVEPRLLTIVADNHGAYFELILEQLGVAPGRVAIVLPASILDDPATFVRAAIAYRMRGYRVVAHLRADAGADLEHVFMAEPHYVALDVPGAAGADGTRRSVAALARRGIHAIARHVESEVQARAARHIGIEYLQGTHFATLDAAFA
jgi:EAL domain-containing protein (putative c-di-GMP-specific phosphodiesterase class I)